MSLFSNCGEYSPGQEPPNTSSLPTINTNILIVKEDEEIYYRLPDDRRPPWQLKWKCVRETSLPCPPGTIGPGIFPKECKPCDGAPGPLGANPPAGSDGCNFVDESECNLSDDCRFEGGCGPIPPVYRCDCSSTPCEPPQVGIKLDCECVTCQPEAYDPLGNPIYDSRCIYPTIATCEQAGCVDTSSCRSVSGRDVNENRRYAGSPPSKSVCRTVFRQCPPATGDTGASVTGVFYDRQCLPCVGNYNSTTSSYNWQFPTRDENNQPIIPPIQGNPDSLCVDTSTCQTTCKDESTCGYVYSDGQDRLDRIRQRPHACMTVAVVDNCPITPDTGCTPTGVTRYRQCLPCEETTDPNQPYVPPGRFTAAHASAVGNPWNVQTGSILPKQDPNNPPQCVPLSACQLNCDITNNCGVSCPPALPRYKCAVIQQEYCNPNVHYELLRIKKTVRECQPCPSGAGPTECAYTSMEACTNSCVTQEFACEGPTNSTSKLTVEPNSNGTLLLRYTRQESSIGCEPPLIGSQSYIRTCTQTECSSEDPECIAYSFPDYNSCIYEWESSTGQCIDPNSNSTFSKAPVVENEETGANVSVSQFPEFGFGDTLGEREQNPVYQETKIAEPTSFLTKFLQTLGIVKNQRVIDTKLIASKKEVEVEKVGRSATILHPVYNFANISNDILTEVIFVDNDLFRDIFADRVAKEVRYVLIRNVEDRPWDERPIQSLTDEKVALSLNPVLLKALNSVHYPDGEKIPLGILLKSIKRHMLMGNLNDFDVQYFIELENKQSQDKFNTYLKSTDKTLLEAAALTLIKEKEVVITKDDKDPYNARRLRRQKRLNVDIKTRTCVIKEDGTACDLPVDNAGLLVGKLSGSSIVDSKIANGVGDGYYLYLNVDGECMPYNLENNEEVTRYPPQNVRYQALKILGQDADITIKAKSLSGLHEFTSGVDLTINYQPMFLRLDLESVSSTPQGSYLVDNTSASYLLMTNEAEINEYLDSYGFATTRVNLDYRDPMLKYIFDTSTLTYSQNDIDFNQLEPKTTTGTLNDSVNAVLSRTLPFALIIVPVRGSAFNPFNGISKIETIDDRVTRKVVMMPTISQNDTGSFESPLEEKFLFNETGTFKVGLKETPDANAITYRFNPSASYLTETFYSKNSLGYSTVPSGVGSLSGFGLANMVKNSIDYIIDTYQVSDIKWFDIYRRLPMAKFVQVMYESNQEILDQIANSFRNNVQISNVFIEESGNNTAGVNYGGSLYTVSENYGILPEDEKVIISVEERIAILNGAPPVE